MYHLPILYIPLSIDHCSSQILLVYSLLELGNHPSLIIRVSIIHSILYLLHKPHHSIIVFIIARVFIIIFISSYSSMHHCFILHSLYTIIILYLLGYLLLLSSIKILQHWIKLGINSSLEVPSFDWLFQTVKTYIKTETTFPSSYVCFKQCTV